MGVEYWIIGGLVGANTVLWLQIAALSLIGY